MTEIKSGSGRVKSFEYVAPEEKQMFSKGPWKWDENISGDKIGISDAEGNDVLYVNHREDVVIPREKDANLIAAATDLYEALKSCLNFMENTESELGISLESADQARAALAKACGES